MGGRGCVDPPQNTQQCSFIQPAGFSINWIMSVNVQLTLIVVTANVFEDQADNTSLLDKRRIVATISNNSCSSPTLQGGGGAGLMPLASLFIDL